VRAALIILLAVTGLAAFALHGHPDQQRVGQHIDSEENEATHVTALGRCGIERWAVKTLVDPAAKQVIFHPAPSTVAALNALPAPVLPSDNTTRLTSERQTYRVTATLVEYKLEADEDIHLVLSDAGKTMIAEMPALACTKGAQHRYAMLVARRKLEATYGTASGSWSRVNSPVTITGVRFFDFKHGQTGVADNAVELHPVVGFRAS
jgi:hypothetical protein